MPMDSISSGSTRRGNPKLGSLKIRDMRSHPSPEQCEKAIHVQPKHILDMLSEYFKKGAIVQSPNIDFEQTLSPTAHSRNDIKTPLNVVLVVSDIGKVDTHNNAFAVKVRLFLIWEVDLAQRDDTEAWRKEAEDSNNGYYPLPREEITKFSDVVEVPVVGFCNTVEMSDADEVGVRVYRRQSESNLDTIVWNMAYFVTIRQPFDLAHMPFDNQELKLSVELTCPATWDKYHLTMVAVIFHKDVKHVSQFNVGVPQVQKELSDSIVQRRKTVVIPLSRHWQYYAHSVVSVFCMLSFFTQLAFCCDIHDVGDRLSVVITLFLTVVAFKFTLDLPKLNYVTTLDHYMLWMMAGLFCSGMLVVGAKKVENLRQLEICPHLLDFVFGDADLYWLDYWFSVMNLTMNALIHLSFVAKALLYQRRSKSISYADGKNFLSFHFAKPYFIPELACPSEGCGAAYFIPERACPSKAGDADCEAASALLARPSKS